MAVFRFRPAAVLELRRRQHESALQELGRVQRERDHAVAALHIAEEALAQARHQLRTQLTAGIDVDMLTRHQNWIAHRHAGTERCRLVIAERERAVERAAADVRRTLRQLRAMERLRDRAWRAHMVAVQRAEAIQMNDLAIARYVRRQGGNE